MDLRLLALVACISHGIATYCTCPASDPYCKRENAGFDTYCYTSSFDLLGKKCNGGECTHDYGTEMCVDKPAHFDKAAAGTTSVSGERCMLNHGASLCECGGAQDSAICERCEGSACQCEAPDSPDCGAWVNAWYGGLCNGKEEPSCKGLTASAGALSSTAYDTEDDNHIWGEPRLGFPGLADWAYVGDVETDVRVTVYVNEPLGILGIGFRGTDSDEEKLIDADFFLDDCIIFQSSDCGRIHGGFQDAFLDDAFKQKMNTKIEFAVTTFAIQKILVTGHSLGGALATIGAYYLAKRNPEWGPMMQVVTFGSPRVGDAAFVAAYRSVVPFTIAYAGRCLVSPLVPTGWDVVTTIPLVKQGFEHVYATWETADDHDVSIAAACHSMKDIYIPHVMKKMQGAIGSSACASVDLGSWTFPSRPPSPPPAAPLQPATPQAPCTCPSNAHECLYSDYWGGNYCYTSSSDITRDYCNGGECTASGIAPPDACTCPSSAHECLYSNFWDGNYCYKSSVDTARNYCNGGQCSTSGIAPLASPSPPSLPPLLAPPPLSPFPPSPPPCVDMDGSATDSYGDGCALYITSWCGVFDDEDFSSSGMCCICGGGFAPPSLPPSPSPPSASPSPPPPSTSLSPPPPSASPSSPPPSASPSPLPPSMSPSPPPAVSPPQSGEPGSFRVVASFTASGEVGDFDEATKRSILSKLAQLAGFASAPLGSTLEVTAGSVIIVAKFPVVTQSEASAAQSSLTQSSVAAGQDSFEAQIGPILATVGASVNDAVVVEVEEDPKPTASSGSPVVAIAVAAAGVAVVAALGGGVYYKKKRRAHEPSKSAMTNIEHGSKPEPVNDAEAPISLA